MKKLFIFYSHTGSGDVVGEYLKNKGYDICKVTPTEKVVPNNFAGSMLVGGFKAMIKAKPQINKIDVDINEFDEIAIGFPIWNGTFAPVGNSILDKLDLNGKNINFILYSGSGEGKKAVERINKDYPNAKVVILKEPKKHKEELEKV